MIRNILIYILFVFLGILFQANILPELLSLNSVPDLLLILSIYSSLKFPAKSALIVSFFCGLVSDFSNAQVVGPQCAGNIIACLFVQSFSKNVYANRFMSIFIITSGAVAVKQLISNIVINVFAPGDSFIIRFTHVLRVLPVEIILTAAIAPICIKILSKRIQINS